MKGEVDQLICLAAAANGVMAGKLDPASFYPGHQSVAYCHKVNFVDFAKQRSGEFDEVERFASPHEWFSGLAEAGAGKVWLEYSSSDQTHAPDHVLAGFAGGGGDWQLVVSGPQETERWIVRWRVQQDPPEGRPWAVTYGCIDNNAGPAEIPRADIESAAARLQAVLRDIHAFAETNAAGWEEIFQRAHDMVRTGPAAMGGIKIPCFTTYPLAARRLYAAAYKAWVFGGMGSWNDMGFEKPRMQADYERLSAELYGAIIEAICAASRSFGGGGPKA